MMGLPYMLGDKDPTDPMDGWDKTWDYLKELGEYIEYYPAGTGATMKELGEGSRDMIPTQMGWDINPRALGIVPKEVKVQSRSRASLDPRRPLPVRPEGRCAGEGGGAGRHAELPADARAQATTYDQGYFYPGPAAKDVTLSMAPPESQDVIKEYGRPEYEKLIADNPQELPLLPDKLVHAFRKWDEEIGAKKTK